MCQDNYTILKEKNKRLTESDLGRLEECLNNNEKIGCIAEKLNADVSTIKKLVTNHRYKTYGKYKEKDCYKCAKYKECRVKGLCEYSKDEYNNCASCKDCNIAMEKCTEYEPIVKCKKLKGHKKVCNGCKEIKTCNRPKLVFTAKKAIENRNRNKEYSKKKTKISKLTADEIKKYNEYVSPKIKKQVSIAVILATMPVEIKEILDISQPTLYSYIDNNELSCNNIDLRNKTKREIKHEKTRVNKTKNRANGRSVHDITEHERENNNICEMDTVEGIKGGKLLFTLITSREHFMFGLPISSKTQENIVRGLDNLEEVLGNNNYDKILSMIKTDNGVEFLDYAGIEISKSGKKRSRVFYADPYASWQKALVENNHRIIRYIIEKGYDISKLADKEIIDIMNRVNNYPRKSLKYSTPYKEIIKVIDKDILEQLGFYYIPIEELDMKNKRVA